MWDAVGGLVKNSLADFQKCTDDSSTGRKAVLSQPIALNPNTYTDTYTNTYTD